jgi:hypothetical protein
MALFEMARKQSEANKQTKQVYEDYPFVAEVRDEARYARAGLEAGEGELIEDDRSQPGQRDAQRVMMEERHAKQRESEEDKID